MVSRSVTGAAKVLRKSAPSRKATYPVLAPLRSVPNDVVASLMAGTQDLRGHMFVLREPHAQLLVPSPVACVPRVI